MFNIPVCSYVKLKKPKNKQEPFLFLSNQIVLLIGINRYLFDSMAENKGEPNHYKSLGRDTERDVKSPRP